MKKSYSYLLPGILLLLLACERQVESTDGPPFDGTAYQPLYATAEEISAIESQPSRALRHPGKIYIKGDFLFVNEQGEGIHIIDNHDPTAPQKISFLKIMANFDIAVQGNYLYADNARDLVVLDIQDPVNVRVVKRIEKAIPQNDFPPYTNVWFRCVEADRGAVVGWEKVPVSSRPACFR